MSELIQIGEAENGREVALHLHQQLRITLPEVRTAGFRWILRQPPERVLSLVEDAFEPPSGAAAPGASALHRWDFRADQPGLASIVLEYRRSWERAAAPARSFSLTVRVA